MGSQGVVVAGLAIMALLILPGCGSLSSLSDNESLNDTFFKNYWKTPDDMPDPEPEDQNITYVAPEIEGYRIGSYNVQIFGKTKANNVPVVQGLAQVINDYDVLAFQEIRDKSETAFPLFIADRLPNMQYDISPRLGRTSSKEQYAFIYSDRVQVIGRQLVYPDPEDVFEREPYMTHVRIGNETYVFIQMHTKPTEATQEIRALPKVMDWAAGEYGDDDIILLGDLNADCYYYTGDYLDAYIEIIPDDADTTTGRSDCAYDRMYIQAEGVEVLDSGVDYMRDDGINEDLSEAMSDHWPIYAVIS